MKNNALRKGKTDESWLILSLCFLMVCVALGFCSTSKSLYISAITEALNFSRSAFSINDSFRYITTAVVNLFFGSLIAKFGAKKLIGAGFVCLILSCIIYSVASSVYVFYLGGIFLGMGLAWTTTTMVGYVVNIWCRKNEGTILGAILASNGIGSAVAMQIVSPIIYQEGNPFGYQDAYRLVTILLVVVAVIILIFFKNSPKQEIRASTAEKNNRGRSWSGIALSDAVKRMYFYGALVCIFLTGVILQGITGAAAPLLKDAGLDAGYVATVLSINSLTLTCFKFLTGFIYDKKGLRFTASTCMTTSVIIIFMLSLITASPTGKVLAMLYGIFASLAVPLETVMLPIFAADLFGEKDYNKILGIVVSVNTAGYAVGAPITNLCYDLTSSYHIALYIGAALMLVVLIGMQFIISAANREHALSNR